MRIYIVDDDPKSCRLLEKLVQLAGHDPIIFTDAAQFLRETDHARLGCVLLDVQMPHTGGLDVLAELTARTPSWPTIMISGTTEVDDAITAFRRGALHFLRKPFRRAEFDTMLGEAAAVAVARAEAHRRATEASMVRLSPREREILAALAKGDQSKVIACHLGLSVRTVDMHHSNILTKLSARNASQAVSIARSLALIPEAA